MARGIRVANKVNPNMLDVAHHAGVSIATVSNVINRPEKVTAKTTEKVRASIEALGFVRNDQARSLAVGSSRTLGLVVADIENSLFVDMAHGAQQSAAESGFRMLLGNTVNDARQQDEYLDLFDETRVGGLLLAPMEDSAAGIRRMRSHGRQIVLLNYAQEGLECCTVLVDNEMVGFVAAQHLIDSGCRRLAFVAGDDHFQPVKDRRIGVLRAIAESAETVSIEQLDSGDLRFDDGLRTARRLLDRRADTALPDGIVAVTDVLAHGLIQGLAHYGGVETPADIRILGCEDNRSATNGRVPLTTVHPPGFEMGAQAVRMLLAETSSNPGEHEHSTFVFQPTLVVRESTGGREPIPELEDSTDKSAAVIRPPAAEQRGVMT